MNCASSVNVLIANPIMNTTAIVTFPNPDRAFDALEALEASIGSVAGGSIVATKDLNGNLLVTETTREKIGAGATAGLPLGAAAMILGAAAGALIGAVADFLNGVGQTRLDQNIGRELKAGETALVIDVSEKDKVDFEVLMNSVGGTIARHPFPG